MVSWNAASTECQIARRDEAPATKALIRAPELPAALPNLYQLVRDLRVLWGLCALGTAVQLCVGRKELSFDFGRRTPSERYEWIVVDLRKTNVLRSVFVRWSVVMIKGMQIKLEVW
jgi:hypothetical protein